MLGLCTLLFILLYSYRVDPCFTVYTYFYMFLIFHLSIVSLSCPGFFPAGSQMVRYSRLQHSTVNMGDRKGHEREFSGLDA